MCRCKVIKRRRPNGPKESECLVFNVFDAVLVDERRRPVLYQLQVRNLPSQPGQQRRLPVLFLYGRHPAVLQLRLLQRPGEMKGLEDKIQCGSNQPNQMLFGLDL